MCVCGDGGRRGLEDMPGSVLVEMQKQVAHTDTGAENEQLAAIWVAGMIICLELQSLTQLYTWCQLPSCRF